nr:MAG TPA: minor tail protein [Bacteriophage sp.]
MVRTELDPAGLEKGARRVAGCLGGLKNAAEKLGEAIRTAFTAKKLTEFAKACLALQGEAAGVQSAVEAAFGGMAYKMENFAKDAATQFGLSGTAAKKFGSEYMELAKSAGLAEGTASDMAVALTGLTGDTASAFGIDPAAAADKLKGIFTGEATGLRELGVMLSGTNLQQYALTRGINQSTAAMSEAQQTALRYAYVTDALRLVSGDFARTQGSWTSQTQLLTQQWRELMGVLGQAMATVLLPAVRVLNGIVAALTDTARAVTAVLGALFGKATTRSAATAQQNTAVAQSADMGARAEEGLAKSTRKAGEAANDALAPFDELNLLQKNAAAGETTLGGQGGGNGGKTPAPTVTAGTQVEDTLSPQLQAMVDKIRQLLEPLRAINFEPLAKAFERLKEAAAPLTKTLFAGLEWAWYNIFVPLAAWTIEDLLPAFLDLLAAACRVLTSVLGALQPLALWLWESFLQPLAQWTGGVIVATLQGITDGLNAFSEWIDGHQTAVQNLAVVIGSLSAALAAAIVIYKAWTAAQNAAGAAATAWQVISTAAAPVTNALGIAWDFLSSKIAFVSLGIGLLVAAIVLLIMNWDTVKEVALNVWAAIQEIWAAAAAWFQEYVLTPLGEFFSFLWQGIQAGALAVWEGIQTAWAVAADWFYNVLILPLTAHFTALFTFFKNIFQGLAGFLSGVFTGDWKKAWEGIKKFAMAPIEAVKSFFEKIFGTDLGESIKGGLNTLIDLVNRFIGWLNEKLHFSWDGLTILGKELFPAGSVRLANIPSIPRLAQGAVLPANKPFLAMVGEQRHGTNVEAPLDTIKQAVAEVLGQLGGTQEFTAEQPIEIRLDGEVLYRAMERIRAARGVQIGGAFANAY